MKKPATALVARYHALPFPSDHLGDCSENHEKQDILSKLDESANDPEVSQLLLDVLNACAEFDLARVEAATIVGLYVNESSHLERRLKGAVWKIFADKNEDVLVRQHASKRIEAGFCGNDEAQIVERVLFDDEDDQDVRHGAFSYLERVRRFAFVQRLIPRLLIDKYWSKYSSAIARLRIDE